MKLILYEQDTKTWTESNQFKILCKQIAGNCDTNFLTTSKINKFGRDESRNNRRETKKVKPDWQRHVTRSNKTGCSKSNAEITHQMDEDASEGL